VAAADRHGHAADPQRERVAPGEDSAVFDRDPRTLLDPERRRRLASRAPAPPQSTATISARTRREAGRAWWKALLGAVPEGRVNCNWFAL
jgi:hypothetical protein